MYIIFILCVSGHESVRHIHRKHSSSSSVSGVGRTRENYKHFRDSDGLQGLLLYRLHEATLGRDGGGSQAGPVDVSRPLWRVAGRARL